MAERESFINATGVKRFVGESGLIPEIPSTPSIAHAVIIKDEDVFFLCEPDGSIPMQGHHGLGLYYHDCRFLDGCELTVSGARPELLVCTAERGLTATLGLSNADIVKADGTHIERHNIEIKWDRTIDGTKLTLFDRIDFRNLVSHPIDFSVSINFMARFEDVFAVRGAVQDARGTVRAPLWDGNALKFMYEGSDGCFRSSTIRFHPAPHSTSGTEAGFEMSLGPRQRKQILISVSIAEGQHAVEAIKIDRPLDSQRLEFCLRRTREGPLEHGTFIHTDSMMLNKALERSLSDLRILRSNVGRDEYFAAGVPWFVALFGRDSIITALQTLAYDTGIAEQTLRLLASYQGARFDTWREEEPGRILHELRIGEMARRNEIPHTPYYGTVDATPLFLILAGSYAEWTADPAIFNDLRPNIERALEWIERRAGSNGDGYVKYEGKSKKGLANQGWKDSADAIVNRDGSLATPPIALVEVQAYIYKAKILLARLYERAGEIERAEQLRQEAAKLQERFNKDFWVEEGFYALALERGKKQVAVLSSNTGHALWSGIADRDKAQRIAERLMSADMFTGWGVRTLSEQEIAYNPLGYHLGTVWPHDNSLIGSGLRRYGLDEAAVQIFIGLIRAAVHFSGHRLPELFAGFRKEDYGIPVSYPVACQPQAWAAGSVPYMLVSMLGLAPDAFNNRLRIVRPVLPDFVSHVEVLNLRVGTARLDLKFIRTNGSISAHVMKTEGQVEVELTL